MEGGSQLSLRFIRRKWVTSNVGAVVKAVWKTLKSLLVSRRKERIGNPRGFAFPLVLFINRRRKQLFGKYFEKLLFNKLWVFPNGDVAVLLLQRLPREVTHKELVDNGPLDQKILPITILGIPSWDWSKHDSTLDKYSLGREKKAEKIIR